MLPAYRNASGPYPSSELILRPDGSVYHLGVRGEHVADDVLLVGDPDRVPLISSRFDAIEFEVSSREFSMHTGLLGGKRISVVSTGIGVDNIDIVLNELDAAVNIDPTTRRDHPERRSLRIIRLGTSGSLQEEIGPGSFVGSAYALGMDGVPYHYGGSFEPDEVELAARFREKVFWPEGIARAYAVSGSPRLMSWFKGECTEGITLTANGFYGPQGRSLRLPLVVSDIKEQYTAFQWKGLSLSNFEMECSGLYALSALLGHEAFTVCVILADRKGGKFHPDPSAAVDQLISLVLERICANSPQ